MQYNFDLSLIIKCPFSSPMQVIKLLVNAVLKRMFLLFVQRYIFKLFLKNYFRRTTRLNISEYEVIGSENNISHRMDLKTMKKPVLKTSRYALKIDITCFFVQFIKY